MAQTNKKYYFHTKRDHVLMASRNHFYLQLIPLLAFSVVCAKLHTHNLNGKAVSEHEQNINQKAVNIITSVLIFTRCIETLSRSKRLANSY